MDRAKADAQLVSRARAALLGLVAGNQLGVPPEHLGTPDAIKKAFPNGLSDLGTPPKNSPYDDDAAMTLLLGESLLASRGFDVADVARRWVKWMKVDGRGIGNTTKRALTLIDRGKEPFEAGRLAYQENPRGSAGNGSVMRCLPVALLYHDDVERLIRVSTQQAAITHSDERCTWGAAVVNLAARELLHGNIYFIEEVLHRIGDRAPRALRDAIHRVPRERESDLPITPPGETGYVVHCIEIAFWFVTHDWTLEDALIFLAQAGGDTDTNAAVAGALLGARYGEGALPPRWMDQLVGVQGIGKLAEELVRAA